MSKVWVCRQVSPGTPRTNRPAKGFWWIINFHFADFLKPRFLYIYNIIYNHMLRRMHVHCTVYTTTDFDFKCVDLITTLCCCLSPESKTKVSDPGWNLSDQCPTYKNKNPGSHPNPTYKTDPKTTWKRIQILACLKIGSESNQNTGIWMKLWWNLTNITSHVSANHADIHIISKAVLRSLSRSNSFHM